MRSRNGLREVAHFLYPEPLSRAGAATAARCGGAVMELGFLVTRMVRQEVRRRRPAGLSLQQFRALVAVESEGARTPSELADFLGLAPATATKLIDGLAGRGFMTRRRGADGRSRLLEVTRAGSTALDAAFTAFRAQFTERLRELSPAERARITAAVELLRPLLTPSERA